MARKLYRSESNRMIAGVCGGLGDYIGVDAAIVRVGWLVSSFVIGWGLPAYLVAWIIVPTESRIDVSPRQAVGDGIRDVTQTTWRFTKEALKALRHKEQAQGDSTGEEQVASKEDSQE